MVDIFKKHEFRHILKHCVIEIKCEVAPTDYAFDVEVVVVCSHFVNCFILK